MTQQQTDSDSTAGRIGFEQTIAGGGADRCDEDLSTEAALRAIIRALDVGSSVLRF